MLIFDWDPIEDEHKKLTLEEWVFIMKKSLSDFEQTVSPNVNKPGETQTDTYTGWHILFNKYMSW